MRAEELLVVDALFDSLTTWDDGLLAAPGAALRWRSRDLRVWRFTLRADATFHDGTPVRPRDFVAAWSATAASGAAGHHLRDVVGYDALRSGKRDVLVGVREVAPRVLEVRLRRPIADFPSVVAHPALGPMPAARVNTSLQAERPIGNGPFKMAEPWVRGRFVRLTRARPSPPPPAPDAGRLVEEIIFRIQDPATGYLAFEQGRVDVAEVPAGGLRFSAATETPEPGPDGRVLRGRLPSTYLLGIDARVPPFDDVNVRRAIALAIDRQRLISEVFEGNAGPGWTIVPSVIPGGRFRTCSSCRFSPGAARSLFAQAGVDRLELWISDDSDHDRVAGRVRADLADAGVTVTIRSVPFDRFQRVVRNGRAGLFRFGWTLDYPTMDNALRPLFHSRSVAARGGANVFGYGRSAVDELLDRAAAARNPQRRRALFGQAEDLVIERDQAVVPLVSLRRRVAVSDRVEDLTYSPMGTADLVQVRVSDTVAEEEP